MKWFWYSLLVFCLLMCSCRTKNLSESVGFESSASTETNLVQFQSLADTSRFFRVEIDKSKLKITETIKITEYDEKSGKPIKETEAKRETTQDSDKVVTEEENQSVTNCNGLEVGHFRDATQMVDSETKEESCSDLGMFLEQFGKSLGIIMGIALIVGLIGLYLKRKFSS